MATPDKDTDILKLKKKLHTIVLQLGSFDYSCLNKTKDPGLFEGYAGLSLFYYNLYRYTKQQKHYRLSFSYMEQAYNGLDFSNLNLSYGSSGIMWLLDYYKRQKAFVMDYEELLSHYDKSIGNYIGSYSGNLDPMHGLLGIGNYLLQRSNEDTSQSLAGILDILDAKKIRQADRTYWENAAVTPGDKTEVHVNFGYAHGIPAILNFLSRMEAKGPNPVLARELFESTFRYFLDFKDETTVTPFPSHVQGTYVKRNNRVAYCYGGLGIASGLMAIYKNREDETIKALCRDTALNIAAVSLSEDKTAFHDIGLCHGAAGNGHMFLKLYKYFRNKILLEAALKQYEDLLLLQQKGRGIAGFVSIDFDDAQQSYAPKTDPGFINGTAGVGLAILSFLNYNSRNNWDSVLGLS